jgi:hypothetical protein
MMIKEKVSENLTAISKCLISVGWLGEAEL